MAHVIYLDDSERERANVAQVLEEAGYRVTAVASITGLEALLPDTDLVLVDYHMPGMNGAEALRALRAKSGDPGRLPPFYLYTSDKARGSEYRQLGFDGRIILKGNPEALVKQVASALRIRALRELGAR